VNGLTLRRFRAGDLEEVFGLVWSTVETSYAGVYPPAAIAFFHEYHRPESILSDASEGYTVVVHDDGRLVGTGSRLDSDVRRVFVRPEHQGQGIGRLIMAELETEALAQGIERLGLSASLPALEFYLALGYTIASEESYELEEGARLDYYEMAKDLRPRGG
jgi:GNAT superfamily N-acetyltransferase